MRRYAVVPEMTYYVSSGTLNLTLKRRYAARVLHDLYNSFILVLLQLCGALKSEFRAS